MDERLLGCPHAFFFYARLSDLLVVANSSLNVFIYCCFSRHFSRAVRNATTRRRRTALDDSLDSRQETISGALRPQPRKSAVQTLELVTRGGDVLLPTDDTACVLLEQVPVSDCEATDTQQDVTVALTHTYDSV